MTEKTRKILEQYREKAEKEKAEQEAKDKESKKQQELWLSKAIIKAADEMEEHYKIIDQYLNKRFEH